MTQKIEEASHPIFYCAEPLLKRDVKSMKGKGTFHLQSLTQTKTIIVRTNLACNQLCIYAAVCAWFDQNNVYNKEGRHRGVPELSDADLTNLTHRKDLIALGDRL